MTSTDTLVVVPPARVTSTLLSRLLATARQLVSFGAIGAFCFVVDLGVYNLLRATVLDDKPIGAKVVSAVVSTAVAYVLNRFITFRAERTTGRRETIREGLLFALTNLIGLGIAAACLYVSHYLLGYTSTLADNVAGNGVGLVLGTAFRFAAYKALVFRSHDARRTKEIVE
ncbi:Putative flippase GtrA (transmembrane translocase of bactoprenol-linked glucose) [Curtobacterium sp. 9128]|uniref:GtrA family protein n=1 Tax=Curtobacterium sp. 9128 TaxID=1793722 RepID=UPI0007D71F09|nr:GtrA family protein [Curtobacterium sp. 9128]SBN62709.1 Putative flippase GtrA (transmembrane translocase of bactoprenol-linked glucose) [Curtobacterium sp. 9128]